MKRTKKGMLFLLLLTLVVSLFGCSGKTSNDAGSTPGNTQTDSAQKADGSKKTDQPTNQQVDISISSWGGPEGFP